MGPQPRKRLLLDNVAEHEFFAVSSLVDEAGEQDEQVRRLISRTLKIQK